MKLKRIETVLPVLLEGEGLPATRNFQVGAGGVSDIEATPMGVVIRRTTTITGSDGNTRELPDLLVTAGGVGVLAEKPAKKPEMGRGK